MPGILNLGCGEDYIPAAHNVDASEEVPADEHLDLEETPWPWDDGSFGHVLAKHVLEHLDTVPWGELERVTEDGGFIELVYPIGHTRFEDATHEHHWNYNTAEMLSGEREHSHEGPLGQSKLVETQTTYWVSEGMLLSKARAAWMMRRIGPGPWMSQVPGLYGEVRAKYLVDKDGGLP